MHFRTTLGILLMARAAAARRPEQDMNASSETTRPRAQAFHKVGLTRCAARSGQAAFGQTSPQVERPVLLRQRGQWTGSFPPFCDVRGRAPSVGFCPP